MDEDLKKGLEVRRCTDPAPALARVRRFLVHYVHDADRELVERVVRGVMKTNRRIIVEAVQAIDEVIAVPQPPGALYEVVAYEGNQVLDDETDAGAARWLEDLAAQLRDWLGEHAPAPSPR